MAGAQAKADGRGVSGDQPETVPARQVAMLLCLSNEPVVKLWHGRGSKFRACLSESLGAHLVRQLRLLLQMAKEFIKFGLHALAHAGEHERHQGR